MSTTTSIPAFSICMLLYLGANAASAAEPSNQKEFVSQHDNFAIAFPENPLTQSFKEATLYSTASPPFPANPLVFINVIVQSMNDIENGEGNELLASLRSHQQGVVNRLGGTHVEDTPIRWCNHIGLRSIYSYKNDALPVPIKTVDHSIWIDGKLYTISYGQLDFIRDPFLSTLAVSRDASRLFETFRLLEEVDSERVPIRQPLEGSWIVRTATLDGTLKASELGAEYTFNHGRFRGLDRASLQTNSVPIGNAFRPVEGRYTVDAGKDRLDLHDDALVKLGVFTPAIYRIVDERLEICCGAGAEDASARPTDYQAPKDSGRFHVILTRPGDLAPDLTPSPEAINAAERENEAREAKMAAAVTGVEKVDTKVLALSKSEAIAHANLWQALDGTWKHDASNFDGSGKHMSLKFVSTIEGASTFVNADNDERFGEIVGTLEMDAFTSHPIKIDLLLTNLKAETSPTTTRLVAAFPQDGQPLSIEILNADKLVEESITLRVRLHFKDSKPFVWVRSGAVLEFSRQAKAD